MTDSASPLPPATAPRLRRPAPLPVTAAAERIDGNARYRQVEEWLTQGRPVCVTDTYGTALTLYGWIRRSVQRRRPVVDPRTYRLYRQLLRQLTGNLLVPVAGHRVQLKRAPAIPWLAVLYPDQDEFLLPLPDLLGLNASWQWYQRGVRYRVLEHPVHPFYGVPFTTHGEHLELLDEYLARVAGAGAPPRTALDVDTAAGPVALLLLQRGVPHVEATDANPNALRSLQEDLARLGLTARVQLRQAAPVPAGPPVELIVCHLRRPAGLPAAAAEPEESPAPAAPEAAAAASVPDEVAQFCAAAAPRLQPAGRLVLLFSDATERLDGPLAAQLGARVAAAGWRIASRAERPVVGHPDPVAAAGTEPGPRSPQPRPEARWRAAWRAGRSAQLWELARA